MQNNLFNELENAIISGNDELSNQILNDLYNKLNEKEFYRFIKEINIEKKLLSKAIDCFVEYLEYKQLVQSSKKNTLTVCRHLEECGLEKNKDFTTVIIETIHGNLHGIEYISDKGKFYLNTIINEKPL